jgi:hypothetical protein
VETFKQLICRTPWSHVENALCTLYGEHAENSMTGYRDVYETLLALEPTFNDEGWKIVLDLVVQGDDTYTDVSTVKGGSDEQYSSSLSLWEDWLGYFIEENNQSADAIAHILYEMTFYGFTNDKVQELAEDMASESKAIDAGNYMLTKEDCPFCSGTKTFDDRSCSLCDEDGKVSVMHTNTK